MSSVIHVLDDHTINKIAAGEVIENPASVVKELVENAIDAKATAITVEITSGGRQLIRVSDNGCGMNADDALLCLERHATSKLRQIEDIHTIGSMGFRGEAIPSISSISKFMLLTCPQEKPDTDATLVLVEGGRILKCSPSVRSPGTTIEVKSLFFNVPVRKKFQRSPTYDANEILKVMQRICLAYPEISFQLISNQKHLLSTQNSSSSAFSEQLGNRIQDLLGEDFFTSLFPIDENRDGIHLQGFIGYPQQHRPNRSGQFLFINHRCVYSYLVSHAIKEGYGHALPTNRHPIFVLHLTMQKDSVDVNVHPQKREVRLQQESQFHDIIFASIDRALQGVGLISEEDFTLDIPPSSYTPVEQKISFPEIVIEEPKDISAQPLLLSEPEKETYNIPSVLATIPRYTLISGEGQGITVVNQRAAHARIIFEKLSQDNTTPASQVLLLPHTLDITPSDAALLRENLNELTAMGFEIQDLGQHTFVVHAIPQILQNEPIEALLFDMLHEMRHYGNIVEKERKKRLALSAAQKALPRTQHLSRQEAQSFITQLMHCQNPTQCPLGRPTMSTLSQEDLAKRF